ncbi:prolyl oligopeptidase family serine peptidase, partial [Mariniblastus sp.]|nr:prolyl oligopeptidase family serine peptidase [Mariniblastus sp.]
HGRGESKGPLSVVKKWGPPKLVAEGRKLPYIIASPQCPESPSYWTDDTQQANLVALVAHLEKTLAIDQRRMYLTGLSMGGYGSWTMAANMPGKFAAVVPICGGGDTAKAAQLKDTPVWAWHGTADSAVPFKASEEMVAAIREAGGEKVRLTSLEGIGHNSWSAAYATPELYKWFNKHATEPVEPAGTTDGSLSK